MPELMRVQVLVQEDRPGLVVVEEAEAETAEVAVLVVLKAQLHRRKQIPKWQKK